MSRAILTLLALSLLAAGAIILALASRSEPDQPGSASEGIALPSEPLEEFQLTAQNGSNFDSQSLDGQIWIASFFFASCPASCRKQNEAIAGLEREFGDQGVKFLAISVDPATDSPNALQNYAESFGAKPDTWFFLTDANTKRIDYTRRIGEDIFKVPVTTRGHADTLILVNREGVIEDYYNWKKSERMVDLRNDIETLLAGKPLRKDSKAEAENVNTGENGSPGE